MVTTDCTHTDCLKPQRARGYCCMHLARLYRTGSVELTNLRQTFCEIPGCSKASRSRGLCHNHWMMAHRMRHDKDVSQLALNLFPTEPLVAEIKRACISSNELVRRSQVPRRTVQRVLSTQKQVTASVADRLCYALGTHPIFIFGDDWIRWEAA